MGEDRVSETLSARAAFSAPDENGWRRRLREPELLATLALSLVALALHLLFFNHAGALWRDEVNTVNLAARPSLAEMARDSFPVLMPLVVHGWTAAGLGHSDSGLRALGLLVGLSLVAALWVAALVTSGAPPKLGLALFALNGTIIIYGDSLRPYGVGSALILLAFAATASFLQRPTTWHALGAAALAVLSVQALYQNAVLVAALCCGAWAVTWRRRSWRAAGLVGLMAAASAASLVPYLPVLTAGSQSAAVLRGGFQWPRACAAAWHVLGAPAGIYAYFWAAAGLATLVFGCATCMRGRNGPLLQAQSAPHTSRSALEGLFAATTLVTALAGFGAFHWFAAFPPKPWYLLPLLALVAACLDAGLPPLPRLPRAALLGGLLATAAIALPCAYGPLTVRLTNVDLLARRLTAEAAPGDFIVVAPWFCGLTFNRYYHGAAAWSTLPPLEDHSLHRYDLLRAQLQNPNAIQPVLGRIAAALQAGHKVWVVGHMLIFRPGTPPPADLPPAPLPNSGWSDAPYQRIWLTQVACFLANHSRQVDRLYASSAGEINRNEDLELVQAAGWQSAPLP